MMSEVLHRAFLKIREEDNGKKFGPAVASINCASKNFLSRILRILVPNNSRAKRALAQLPTVVVGAARKFFDFVFLSAFSILILEK